MTFSFGQHSALLLFRASLGLMWLAHALLKYLVFGLAGTASFLQSQGLPGWIATPLFGIELAGALAILAGLYARQISLLLCPVLLGAVWVHWSNGWLFSAAGGGWEYPAFLLVSSYLFWALPDSKFQLKTSHFLLPKQSPQH
jgi:putative oxidoreductase